MDSTTIADTSVINAETETRPALPRLVTDDLQGRVNALAAALITQGYEPTFVRLRAGLGRTPQDILQRAFEYWKTNVRPAIGRVPERVATWGNEVHVPDAIRDLFSETWRRTLVAARMVNQYSEESLDKATVSEETKAIRACVDRLEGMFALHQEQRRVDAETFRSLTVRLAEVCAQSEEMRSRLEEKLSACGTAADRMKRKILDMNRSINCAQLEALAALGDWRQKTLVRKRANVQNKHLTKKHRVRPKRR
jgi:hypothetical protein